MRLPVTDYSHRARVAATVARLADLLEEWERWEIDQLLPPKERHLARPEGDRSALSVVHQALLTELQDLDAAVRVARTHVLGSGGRDERGVAAPPE